MLFSHVGNRRRWSTLHREESSIHRPACDGADLAHDQFEDDFSC